MNTGLNDAQLPPTLPEQAMSRRRFLTAAGAGGALPYYPRSRKRRPRPAASGRRDEATAS
jgi:hypothetical protein